MVPTFTTKSFVWALRMLFMKAASTFSCAFLPNPFCKTNFHFKLIYILSVVFYTEFIVLNIYFTKIPKKQ
jgi:hypothetical protein